MMAVLSHSSFLTASMRHILMNAMVVLALQEQVLLQEWLVEMQVAEQLLLETVEREVLLLAQLVLKCLAAMTTTQVMQASLAQGASTSHLRQKCLFLASSVQMAVQSARKTRKAETRSMHMRKG